MPDRAAPSGTGHDTAVKLPENTEVARLREALEAFADPRHWAVTRDHGQPVPIWVGTYRQHPAELAREALRAR